MDNLVETVRLSLFSNKLNLKKSTKDRRDYIVKPKSFTSSFIDLRNKLPPVFDQGTIGSCTANSASSMYSYIYRIMTGKLTIPSRLYIYYNTRLIMDTIGYDSGASIRNTMKSIAKYGICDEIDWTYFKPNLTVRPFDSCYQEGYARQALSYASIPISISNMKAVLQSHPFIIGVAIYSSFMTQETTRTGNVPIPNKQKERLLGYHALCVVGYNDKKSVFIVRNSWGIWWGDRGDCYIPYNYLTNPTLAFDAWVLYTVEIPITNAFIIKR